MKKTGREWRPKRAEGDSSLITPGYLLNTFVSETRLQGEARRDPTHTTTHT
jgi:hypothetical protein